MIRALVVLLALALVACGGGVLDTAVRSVNASGATLEGANRTLEAWHLRAATLEVDRVADAGGTEAEARKRADAVHAAFDPAWDAYTDARAAWLAAHAATSAALLAEAAKDEPDLPHVLAAVASAARALAAFEVAVERLRKAAPSGRLTP